MKYVIKARLPYKGDMLSLVESTLSTSNEFMIATSSASYFNSPASAAAYAKKHCIVENRTRLGGDTCPYIVGPRGGTYSIFSGEYRT